MSQGGDINVGNITWRELAKDKARLQGIINSAIKAGQQQGVVLTPEEWENTIKRRVQNGVKLTKLGRQEGGSHPRPGSGQGEEEGAA